MSNSKIKSFFVNNFSKLLNDKLYLKIMFRYRMGEKLDLKNPQTFSEKLQWLKLYDRNPMYSNMVDKYEAKKYVASIIGEEYIIPTLGIYNKFDEIDFEKLPKQFVMKCTHDSGSLVICKDKEKFNVELVKEKITKSLQCNYYNRTREWPYKNIKPRIIIEKYMEDKNKKSMVDYKFFCFNGTPKIMYISEGLENHKTAQMSFFDMNFKLIDCKREDYKMLDYMPEKPKNFELMKKIAEKLSKNIPHIRVDFYEINGNLYFGELTFFTCSGFIHFEPKEWDLTIGNMLDIKNKK